MLFALIGNPLKLIDLFLMRGEDEAERALALGAPLERVWVTGNTKFDARRATSLAFDGARPDLRAAIGEGGPLLIAGSTHEGEEEILLGAFKKLRADLPTLRLVLAPRRIERAGRLLEVLAREWGFSTRLRSRGPVQELSGAEVSARRGGSRHHR